MSWYTSDRRSQLPPDWPRRRQRILRRDPMCVLCHDWQSTDVDHIVPGADHSDENLRGVCRDCHARKSSHEGGTAAGKERARLRALRKRPPEKHPSGL